MAKTKSTNIRVFPSAFRTNTYDPEAALNTEENITKISTKINEGASNANYVIRKDGNSLYFVISGYWFKIKDVSGLGTPLYAKINLVDAVINNNQDFLNKTLAPIGASVPGTLDGSGDNPDFLGMEFSNSAFTGDANSLYLLDSSGNIPKESRLNISTDQIQDGAGGTVPISEHFTTDNLSATTGTIGALGATTATVTDASVTNATITNLVVGNTVGSLDVSNLNVSTATITDLHANAPTADKVNHKFNIKVNGSLNDFDGSDTKSITIYAPVVSGTSGQFLESSGSGYSPTWKSPSNINVKGASVLVSSASAQTPTLVKAGDNVNPVYFADGKPYVLEHNLHYSSTQLTSLPKNYFTISNSIGGQEAVDSADSSKWTKLDAVFPSGCFVNLVSRIEGSIDATSGNIHKDVLATIKGYVNWSYQNTATKDFFDDSGFIWFRINLNWLKNTSIYQGSTEWDIETTGGEENYMPCLVTPMKYYLGQTVIPTCVVSTLNGAYLYLGFTKISSELNYFEGFNFEITMWLKRHEE